MKQTHGQTHSHREERTVKKKKEREKEWQSNREERKKKKKKEKRLRQEGDVQTMTKKKKKWLNKEKEGKVRERNNKQYIYIYNIYFNTFKLQCTAKDGCALQLRSYDFWLWLHQWSPSFVVGGAKNSNIAF